VGLDYDLGGNRYVENGGCRVEEADDAPYEQEDNDDDDDYRQYSPPATASSSKPSTSKTEPKKAVPKKPEPKKAEPKKEVKKPEPKKLSKCSHCSGTGQNICDQCTSGTRSKCNHCKKTGRRGTCLVQRERRKMNERS
jgi:hypothetical protein